METAFIVGAFLTATVATVIYITNIHRHDDH